MWLGCETFSCVGSASVPGGGLTATTRCSWLDVGVVTLTTVHTCKIDILFVHIRVLFGVRRVHFFFCFGFPMYIVVSTVDVTRGLSLLPSPPVASGSYSGACCLVSRRAWLRAEGVRPSF